MGDTNRLLKDKLQRETMKQDSDESIDREINKNIKKQASETRVEPVVVSKVQPQDLNLLQVDNEEYKKRRDEALQKPGAVVGNITLR
jgi:hypothetical protein